MRIYIFGRRIYRVAIVLILALLLLPLLHFYASRSFNPQSVHFQEPRGEAVKVVSEPNRLDENFGILTRIMENILDFYQNRF